MNPTPIIDMASAFYESCVLFTASDLGIFGKLAEIEEADAKTIADVCELNERGARFLLDACVALNLLTKTGEYYRNTRETAMFLVPGTPGDLSGALRYNRDVYPAWGRLCDMVRTGEPAERPDLHLGKDKERTRTFALAMHSKAMGIGRAIVPQLDLAGKKKLFDVGGGPGTTSMLIAEAHPDINCTVLDLPEVVKVADELIAEAGAQERVKTVSGDYHSHPFPSGNDVVLFFGWLHQESPDAIRDLFRRTFEALLPGGLVYVVDMMTDITHTQPKFSALFAVNMALTTDNGWVFSDEELRSWLADAGFSDFSCRPLPPPLPHWLAVARKP